MPIRPIRSLLVANRGEIAIRVFRVGPRAGHPHRRRSTRTRTASPCTAQGRRGVSGRPGQATPIRRYLNIAAIIGLAARRGVDAIHPGYGFLSENAGVRPRLRGGRASSSSARRPSCSTAGRQGGRAAAGAVAGVPVLPGTAEPSGRTPRPRGSPRRRSAIRSSSRPRWAAAGAGCGSLETRRGARRAVRQAPREAEAAFGVRRRLPGEVHPSGQAHRGPAPRRRARQPRPPVRARLLRPAPAPEGHRDRARAVQPRPGAPRAALRRGASRSAAPSATTTRARSSSWSMQDRATSTSSRSTRGSRSSTPSPRWSPASTSSRARSWSPRASALRPGDRHPEPGRGPDARLRHPVPDHDRGPGEQVHARLRPDHPLPLARRASASGSTAAPRSPARSITPFYDSLLVKLSAMRPRFVDAATGWSGRSRSSASAA